DRPGRDARRRRFRGPARRADRRVARGEAGRPAPAGAGRRRSRARQARGAQPERDPLCARPARARAANGRGGGLRVRPRGRPARGTHARGRQARGRAMSVSVDLVLDAKAAIGECPIWSEDERVLYWIDIPRGRLNRLDPATGKNTYWMMPAPIGSFALRETSG